MAGNFQVRERITKLPIVALSQNGTGQQYRQREVFDEYGRLGWAMNPRGYITRYDYEVATGALRSRIDDVDVALAQGVPEGWTTPQSGGLNLVTDYVSDAQGRVLQELGPWHQVVLNGEAGEADVAHVRTVQFTVYRDAEHEMLRCMGYVRQMDADGAYGYGTLGPVRITRLDHDGRVTDEIEAVRACACGPLSPVETFDRSQWRKWRRVQNDLWGRVLEERVYHVIPANGDGLEGEHYTVRSFAYDALGRKIREVGPGARLRDGNTMCAAW